MPTIDLLATLLGLSVSVNLLAFLALYETHQDLNLALEVLDLLDEKAQNVHTKNA